MLTKVELCQCFLTKAQQKFGKAMSELDAYYAGSEVGLALAYMGMIKDQNTLDYIKHNITAIFKHPSGKELTYLELLNMLPEKIPDKDISLISQIKDNKENKEVKLENGLTEEQIRDQRNQDLIRIKDRLGERKYFRLLDAFEYLKIEEFDAAINLLKLIQKDQKDQKDSRGSQYN